MIIFKGNTEARKVLEIFIGRAKSMQQYIFNQETLRD